MNQKSIPRFNSEAEEAQWWYEQRDQLTAKAEEAANSGALQLRRLSSSSMTTHLSKSVKICLSEQDLLRAHKLAENQGLREEVYFTMLLHEALDAEEAATT